MAAASPQGSSGRAFPEITEEAAWASPYRPHLPLHKSAPLSPRVIAAPARLLPRAGGRLPAAPRTPSACLEGRGHVDSSMHRPRCFPRLPPPEETSKRSATCPFLQTEKLRPHRGHLTRQGTSNPWGKSCGANPVGHKGQRQLSSSRVCRRPRKPHCGQRAANVVPNGKRAGQS